MSENNWFWFRFSTPRVCEFKLPLGTPWTHQKPDWLLTYFARNEYILVLAALTRAVGWKSTELREISTHTICFLVHKLMPIRCLNPQPSMVKNWSQQEFFLRYLKYIGISHIVALCNSSILSITVSLAATLLTYGWSMYWYNKQMFGQMGI